LLADQLYRVKLFAGTGNEINGDPIFDLERPLNRIEALTLVTRLMGLEQEAYAYTGPNPFADVPEWADRIAAFAYYNGITVGINNTSTCTRSKKDR
jgi:hypothetical protein